MGPHGGVRRGRKDGSQVDAFRCGGEWTRTKRKVRKTGPVMSPRTASDGRKKRTIAAKRANSHKREPSRSSSNICEKKK